MNKNKEQLDEDIVREAERIISITDAAKREEEIIKYIVLNSKAPLLNKFYRSCFDPKVYTLSEEMSPFIMGDFFRDVQGKGRVLLKVTFYPEGEKLLSFILNEESKQIENKIGAQAAELYSKIYLFLRGNILLISYKDIEVEIITDNVREVTQKIYSKGFLKDLLSEEDIKVNIAQQDKEKVRMMKELAFVAASLGREVNADEIRNVMEGYNISGFQKERILAGILSIVWEKEIPFDTTKIIDAVGKKYPNKLELKPAEEENFSPAQKDMVEDKSDILRLSSGMKKEELEQIYTNIKILKTDIYLRNRKIEFLGITVVWFVLIYTGLLLMISFHPGAVMNGWFEFKENIFLVVAALCFSLEIAGLYLIRIMGKKPFIYNKKKKEVYINNFLTRQAFLRAKIQGIANLLLSGRGIKDTMGYTNAAGVLYVFEKTGLIPAEVYDEFMYGVNIAEKKKVREKEALKQWAKEKTTLKEQYCYYKVTPWSWCWQSREKAWMKYSGAALAGYYFAAAKDALDKEHETQWPHLAWKMLMKDIEMQNPDGGASSKKYNLSVESYSSMKERIEILKKQTDFDGGRRKGKTNLGYDFDCTGDDFRIIPTLQKCYFKTSSAHKRELICIDFRMLHLASNFLPHEDSSWIAKSTSEGRFSKGRLLVLPYIQKTLRSNRRTVKTIVDYSGSYFITTLDVAHGVHEIDESVKVIGVDIGVTYYVITNKVGKIVILDSLGRLQPIRTSKQKCPLVSSKAQEKPFVQLRDTLISSVDSGIVLSEGGLKSSKYTDSECNTIEVIHDLYPKAIEYAQNNNLMVVQGDFFYPETIPNLPYEKVDIGIICNTIGYHWPYYDENKTFETVRAIGKSVKVSGGLLLLGNDTGYCVYKRDKNQLELIEGDTVGMPKIFREERKKIDLAGDEIRHGKSGLLTVGECKLESKLFDGGRKTLWSKDKRKVEYRGSRKKIEEVVVRLLFKYLYGVDNFDGNVYTVRDHNFAFGAWTEAIKKGVLHKDAVLLHFDFHEDFAVPEKFFKEPSSSMFGWILSKFYMGIGHFIVPAVTFGYFSEIYWIQEPGDENHDISEDVLYYAAVCLDNKGDKRFYWDTADPRGFKDIRVADIKEIIVHKITENNLPDFSNEKRDIVLDVDEDYILRQDHRPNRYIRKGTKILNDRVDNRIKEMARNVKCKHILPVVTTIAESPIAFCTPTIYVERIKRKLLVNLYYYKICFDGGEISAVALDGGEDKSFKTFEMLINERRSDGENILLSDRPPTDVFEGIDLRGKDIVILGCGAGYYVFYAKLMGARSAIGVDIDVNSIEAAKRVCGYLNDEVIKNDIINYGEIKEGRIIELEESQAASVLYPDIHFIAADGANLKSRFKESMFDIAVSVFLIPYLPSFEDQKKVIIEMVRIVKPEGTICVMPNYSSEFGVDENEGYIYYSKGKTKCGFYLFGDIVDELNRKFSDKRLKVVEDKGIRIVFRVECSCFVGSIRGNGVEGRDDKVIEKPCRIFTVAKENTRLNKKAQGVNDGGELFKPKLLVKKMFNPVDLTTIITRLNSVLFSYRKAYPINGPPGKLLQSFKVLQKMVFIPLISINTNKKIVAVPKKRFISILKVLNKNINDENNFDGGFLPTSDKLEVELNDYFGTYEGTISQERKEKEEEFKLNKNQLLERMEEFIAYSIDYSIEYKTTMGLINSLFKKWITEEVRKNFFREHKLDPVFLISRINNVSQDSRDIKEFRLRLKLCSSQIDRNMGPKYGFFQYRNSDIDRVCDTFEKSKIIIELKFKLIKAGLNPDSLIVNTIVGSIAQVAKDFDDFKDGLYYSEKFILRNKDKGMEWVNSIFRGNIKFWTPKFDTITEFKKYIGCVESLADKLDENQMDKWPVFREMDFFVNSFGKFGLEFIPDLAVRLIDKGANPLYSIKLFYSFKRLGMLKNNDDLKDAADCFEYAAGYLESRRIDFESNFGRLAFVCAGISIKTNEFDSLIKFVDKSFKSLEKEGADPEEIFNSLLQGKYKLWNTPEKFKFSAELYIRFYRNDIDLDSTFFAWIVVIPAITNFNEMKSWAEYLEDFLNKFKGKGLDYKRALRVIYNSCGYFLKDLNKIKGFVDMLQAASSKEEFNRIIKEIDKIIWKEIFGFSYDDIDNAVDLTPQEIIEKFCLTTDQNGRVSVEELIIFVNKEHGQYMSAECIKVLKKEDMITKTSLSELVLDPGDNIISCNQESKTKNIPAVVIGFIEGPKKNKDLEDGGEFFQSLDGGRLSKTEDCTLLTTEELISRAERVMPFCQEVNPDWTGFCEIVSELKKRKDVKAVVLTGPMFLGEGISCFDFIFRNGDIFYNNSILSYKQFIETKFIAEYLSRYKTSESSFLRYTLENIGQHVKNGVVLVVRREEVT
ncbi:MAG: UPF0489 family protein, partial [Candidatus Omnitrophica bacterium]|nr:UPF0489 family protein [Candidatus Omnitrophota bacterium]